MNGKSLMALLALLGVIVLGNWYHNTYMCCCDNTTPNTVTTSNTKLPYYFNGKSDVGIETSASFAAYADSLFKTYKTGDTIQCIGYYYNGEDSTVGLTRAKALQDILASKFAGAAFKNSAEKIASDVPTPNDYPGVIPQFIAAAQPSAPVAKDVTTSVVNADGSLILYFPTGSTAEKFDATTETNIKNVLEAAKQPGKTIMVSGHTDNKGNPDKNMTLSQGRAEKVKSILVKRGADAAIIKTQGFGQTQPLDPADTDGARAKNRRVEVKVQ
jgi:outer membrane protein OmpA-like peptidoglycan-associated protein